MFQSYNQRQDASKKVLLGNWQEEQLMLQLTGVNRCADPRDKAVFLKNSVRVIDHTEREEPKNYCSTTSISFQNPACTRNTKSRAQHNAVPPRARRAVEAHRAQLAAEQAAAAAAAAARAAEEEEAAHASAPSFRAYSAEEMQRATPKRAVKGSAGAVVVSTVAAAARTPSSADAAAAVADYTTDSAVTLWSTRSSGFARSTAFTDPYAYEQAAATRARRVSVTYAGGLPAGLAPGYVRTLVALRQRLVETAVAQHSKHSSSAVVAGAAAAAVPAVPTLCEFVRRFAGLWDSDSGSAGGANVKELRREMGLFGVPLTDAEVIAIVEVLGASRGDGLIDVHEFTALLRAPMSEHRWQLCERLWSALEGGDGSGTVAADLLPHCAGIFADYTAATATADAGSDDNCSNGRVTWAHFADACWSFGACCRDDAVFESTMTAEC